MSSKEMAGASLQLQDRIAVNLLKVWWRCEAFLERWKRSTPGYEDPTEPFESPRHGGYGNIYGCRSERLWIVLAIVATVLFFSAFYAMYSRMASLEDKVDRLITEHDKGLQQ